MEGKSMEEFKFAEKLHMLFLLFIKVSCNDLLEHETVSATEETQKKL